MAVASGWELGAAEVAFDSIFWSVLHHAHAAPFSDGAEEVSWLGPSRKAVQELPLLQGTSDERWPGSRPGSANSAWTLRGSCASTSTHGPAALDLVELVVHTSIERHTEVALADLSTTCAGASDALDAALKTLGGEVETMPPPLAGDGAAACLEAPAEVRRDDCGDIPEVEELRGRLQCSLFARLECGLLEQTLEHALLGSNSDFPWLPEAPGGDGEDVEVAAFLRYSRLCRRLAAFRTPLGRHFDRRAWRRFFGSRLLSESAKRPKHVQTLIERTFNDCSAASLTRGDVEAWLRVTLSTFEDEERPPQWSPAEEILAVGENLQEDAKEPNSNNNEEASPVRKKPTEAEGVEAEARSMRATLEAHLGISFMEGGRRTKEFFRVNSVVANSNEMSPLFWPLPFRLLRSAARCWADHTFRGLGFRRARDDETGIVYWHHKGGASSGGAGGGDEAAPLGDGGRGSDGAALLFVNGVGFGQDLYAGFVRHLVACCRGPVILMECPGLSGYEGRDGNKSPFPRGDEVAECIERIKESLGVGALHAAGHSFGGMLLSAALKYRPGLFQRVAFCSAPVLLFRTTEGWPRMLKENAARSLLDTLSRFGLAKLITQLLLSDPWHQYALRHVINMPEYVHQEKGLDHRTLFVLGDEDNVAVPEIAEYLADEHPQVRVVCHSGGHGDDVFTCPEALAATLADFFSPARFAPL